MLNKQEVTATTMAIAGVKKPEGMQSRVFLGPHADPTRQYAFGARDRIDETVQRIRSVLVAIGPGRTCLDRVHSTGEDEGVSTGEADADANFLMVYN